MTAREDADYAAALVDGALVQAYMDQVAAAQLEERLRLTLEQVKAMPDGNAEWNLVYRQGYDKAMSRVRAAVEQGLAKVPGASATLEYSVQCSDGDGAAK